MSSNREPNRLLKLKIPGNKINPTYRWTKFSPEGRWIVTAYWCERGVFYMKAFDWCSPERQAQFPEAVPGLRITVPIERKGDYYDTQR